MLDVCFFGYLWGVCWFGDELTLSINLWFVCFRLEDDDDGSLNEHAVSNPDEVASMVDM